MTIIGGSPGGLLSIAANTLRYFRFDITQNNTATDTTQKPGASLSVEIYKQGATTDGSGSVASGGSGAISIHHPGQIKAGDTIFADTDTSITATADTVTTNSISFSGVSGGTFTWSDLSRIRASTNQPTLYSNIHGGGSALSNPLTTDSSGFVECYAEPAQIDALVSGSGITTYGISDKSSMPPLSEIRIAEHFPGDDWGEKVLAALQDLNQTWGGVVDARGLIGRQSVAADPFASITWPFLLMLGPADISTDVVWALSNDEQHIRGMGAGISEVKASLNFPSSSRLLSLGDTTERERITVRDFTLNANGLSGSVGLRVHGTGAGCMARDLEIKGALTYGVELAQNTTPRTNAFRGKNLDISMSGTTGIGIYLDAEAGFNNSFEDCVIGSVSASTGSGIDKSNARPASFRNIMFDGAGFTHGIRLQANGGVTCRDIVGVSGMTNVVRAETGVDDYSLSGIYLNSATNALNDADQSITITEDIQHYESGFNSFRALVSGTEKASLNPTGYLEVDRLLSTHGTAHETGDHAIAGSWGSGAAVSSIVTGTTDFAGQTGVTTGTGAGANPTLTITFKTAFPNTPIACLITPKGSTGVFGAGEYIAVTSLTTTAVTFTFVGTPTDSTAYNWYYLIIGV